MLKSESRCACFVDKHRSEPTDRRAAKGKLMNRPKQRVPRGPNFDEGT